MIKKGKGGANTKTGQVFEKKKDLQIFLSTLGGYSFEKINKYWINVHDSKTTAASPVASILKKHGLYNFLKEKGVDWKKIISRQLLPDDSLYVISQNRIIILEYKFQSCDGSVDEKLQTCDFKKKQYKKLFSNLKIEVEYIYVINDYFKQPKYKDVLDYIESVGCSYYFDYPPLDKLGLPTAD